VAIGSNEARKVGGVRFNSIQVDYRPRGAAAGRLSVRNHFAAC